MIKYNLPGLYEQNELNLYFINLYKEHREYFRDDVKIESVFGNFPYCTWDGGRNFPFYKQISKEEVEFLKENYLMFGIHPRFIFTNPEVTKEDLDDRWCNFLLETFSGCEGEVVINSDLMKDYISNNYKDYRIVSSTTKCITNREKALEEIMNPEYYQVCLDYNLNKDIEFLESIPKEYRHKVEFLCNAICPSSCPYRRQHYSKTGFAHLTYMKDIYSVVKYCGISHEINHPEKIGKGNNLSIEDIETYSKMGFQHFKLEGRTLESGSMLGQYLYFMIKPDYYFIIIEDINQANVIVNNYNSENIYEKVGSRKPSPLI